MVIELIIQMLLILLMIVLMRIILILIILMLLFQNIYIHSGIIVGLINAGLMEEVEPLLQVPLVKSVQSNIAHLFTILVY